MRHARSNENLDFEESALNGLSGEMESELDTVTSCESDASSSSSGSIQKRKGLPVPPDQCFDNSGGICPYNRPNLVCCDEEVMFVNVIARGCVICMFFCHLRTPSEPERNF